MKVSIEFAGFINELIQETFKHYILVPWHFLLIALTISGLCINKSYTLSKSLHTKSIGKTIDILIKTLRNIWDKSVKV